MVLDLWISRHTFLYQKINVSYWPPCSYTSSYSEYIYELYAIPFINKYCYNLQIVFFVIEVSQYYLP